MYGDALDWMSAHQFANAVAYGQITPGPVTHTVALVGYAAAGLPGALAATAVAFAPSFAFVLLGARHFERVRTSGNARAFLDGAGPAAAGAILGAAVPLARALESAWQWAILAVAALAARAARPADRGARRRRARGARHYALAMGLAEELQDETAEVLSSLIRFKTVNPPGNERECQEWLAGYLEDAGLEVELDGAEPERPNLVATLRGRRRAGARLPQPRRHRARRQGGLERRPVGRRDPRRLPLRPRHDRHEEPDGRRGGRRRAPRARGRALQRAR